LPDRILQSVDLADALSDQRNPLYLNACDRSAITLLTTGKVEENGSVEFDFASLDGYASDRVA
jgi:hypothetical protein